MPSMNPEIRVAATAPDTPGRTVPNFRWYICGLLLYATTVNYMDRMVLGILKPTIARELGWNDTTYGVINAVFQFGYALMMPLAGRLIDWLGLRLGYSISVMVWSLSSMAHSLAGNATQFAAARLGLGLGAIKAVADWFPQKERALATGIFNSGSNLGSIFAPLLVPIVTAHFGWHAAFIVTGSLSMTWVILWAFTYREPEGHPLLSAKELAYIRQGQEGISTDAVPYSRIIGRKAAWAFLLGKFLTDPVWWFYLFWLPDFLQTKYGVDLKHIGAPLVTIYAMSDVGSIAGGWLSSRLIKGGWSVTRGRKTAMLVCALCVTAVILVPRSFGNLWLTVLLIGVATASHQGWSANLYTIASDCFPRAAVGSVVGLGGLGGAVGGMIAQPAVGKWLDVSHGA